MRAIGEKFGLAFISRRATGSNEEGTCEQVKFASFSNLDLKWYNMTTEIHPEFEKLKGRKFWLGLEIENRDRDGRVEKFQGKFLMPVGLGEGAGGPDIEYLEEVDRIEKEIGQQVDFVDLDDEDELRTFSKAQGIFAFFAPEWKPISHSPLLAYLSMVVIIDDLLDTDETDDTSSVADAMRKTRYSKMNQYLQTTLAALRGDEKTPWKNIDPASILRTPGMGLHTILQFQRYYSGTIQVAKCLREEALKIAETEETAEPFFTALEELYEAGAFESSKEWSSKKGSELFENVESELTKITTGIPVCLEAVALQIGIRLRKDVRKCLLFKRFCNQVATYVRKVNDLLSYNHEMLIGKATSNQVFILHNFHGLELNQALKIVNDEANQTVKSINAYAQLLKEMFENDEHLQRYIDISKGMICGYLQSCSYGARYHPNLVWDCYVDADEDNC